MYRSSLERKAQELESEQPGFQPYFATHYLWNIEWHNLSVTWFAHP